VLYLGLLLSLWHLTLNVVLKKRNSKSPQIFEKAWLTKKFLKYGDRRHLGLQVLLDRAVEMLPLEIRSVLEEAKLALKLPLEPLTFPSYHGGNDRCKN